MATAADLTINKTYTVTIGEEEFKTQAGSTVSVNNVIKRLVTVPTASEVDIVAVGTPVGLGQLTDIGICVIINSDDTNTCRVRFADTGGHTFDVLLKAGQAFDIYNRKLSVSATEGAFASFSDIDTISAQFDVADGDLTILTGENC